MTPEPELVGIFAVGGAVIVVHIAVFAWLKSDIGELRRGMASVRERLSAVETKVDLVLAAKPPLAAGA